MGYKYFKLKFATYIGSSRLSVVASCNQMTGLVCTIYWCHKPIFNLVSDRHAVEPGIVRLPHEWGIIRWGVSRKLAESCGLAYSNRTPSGGMDDTS